MLFQSFPKSFLKLFCQTMTFWRFIITKTFLRQKKKIYIIKNPLFIIINNYFHLENLGYYLQASLKQCKYILKGND